MIKEICFSDIVEDLTGSGSTRGEALLHLLDAIEESGYEDYRYGEIRIEREESVNRYGTRLTEFVARTTVTGASITVEVGE